MLASFQVPPLSLFYRRGNRSFHKLSNLPKVTHRSKLFIEVQLRLSPDCLLPLGRALGDRKTFRNWSVSHGALTEIHWYLLIVSKVWSSFKPGNAWLEKKFSEKLVISNKISLGSRWFPYCGRGKLARNSHRKPSLSLEKPKTWNKVHINKYLLDE